MDFEDADIIILGAGPAGCAASIRGRRAGLRVMMLDSGSGPKVSPGETLHPGIEPILKQLGVLDQVLQAGFRRHRGIWLDQAGSRQFLTYGEDEDGPWFGFQAERKVFHRILQRAAVDAGVTLVRNTFAKAVLVENNRVKGVIADGKRFRAPWTIDATGRSRWLARELGLPEKVCSPPLGVRFGWRTDKNRGGDGEPLFSFREDGWNWQAPLHDNRIAWAKLRIGKPGERRPAGIDLTWRFCAQCAGPGFFLLGDAAVTLDPSSSHGVLFALMSGIFAGHLIESSVRNGALESIIAEEYRAWVERRFENDRSDLLRHYAESPAGERFTGARSGP